MNTIEVDNIKCGGCANRITQKLSKLEGMNSVEVNVEEGLISYEVSSDLKEEDLFAKLRSMGYPRKGESTLIDNAKSYVSCMIGRMDQSN